jgi:hypothetical protein
MGLRDLMGKSEALEGLAMGKVEEWLDDYKKAVKELETFGFTVGKLTVGMGVLPEVRTSAKTPSNRWRRSIRERPNWSPYCTL